MTSERPAFVTYDQAMHDDPITDPRGLTCFVCNEHMEPMKMGPVICWANDRTDEGDYNLWLVFGHPECIGRVAHPAFDLDSQRGKLA
jgi:hypothetical protein